jgi:hypothetical protein
MCFELYVDLWSVYCVVYLPAESKRLESAAQLNKSYFFLNFICIICRTRLKCKRLTYQRYVGTRSSTTASSTTVSTWFLAGGGAPHGSGVSDPGSTRRSSNSVGHERRSRLLRQSTASGPQHELTADSRDAKMVSGSTFPGLIRGRILHVKPDRLGLFSAGYESPWILALNHVDLVHSGKLILISKLCL